MPPLRSWLPRPAGTPPWLVAASAAISLFGLWTSLTYCMGAWFISADLANAAMLWQGVQRHGWAFLQSFGYTQDSWLLSLILPEFAVFSAIGPSPTFVVAAGWLIFLGCATFTLLLIRLVAGGRAVLLTAPVLLLASQAAMAVPGSYGHPVSHNISLLWGLFSLYGATRWLARQQTIWLLLASVALFVAAVSDPWTNAALGVPLLVASLGLALAPAPWLERRAALVLAAAMLAAVALAVTKLAGLLSFLGGGGLVLATPAAMLGNARLLASVLTGMFQVVPFAMTGVYPVEPPPALVVVTCTLLAAALALAVASWWRGMAQVPFAARLPVAVAFLSVAATLVAFCISAFGTGLFAGRFVLNAGFFVPLLVATAAGRFGSAWPSAVRGAVAGTAVLMMLAGAASNSVGWRFGRIRPDVAPFQDIARFLQGEGLTYGFGSYWGSNATAVTWISGGHVIMRPVSVAASDGHVTAWPWQTSPFWWRADDRPAGQARTFLALHDDCLRPAACAAGIATQFGTPDQTLSFKDWLILVWQRPLTMGGPG